MTSNFRLYKKAWVYSGNPHNEKVLNQSDASLLLNRGGGIWFVIYLILTIKRKLAFGM